MCGLGGGETERSVGVASLLGEILVKMIVKEPQWLLQKSSRDLGLLGNLHSAFDRSHFLPLHIYETSLLLSTSRQLLLLPI